MPELRKSARRVVDCAVKGKENWSWAAKEICDRLDGKAAIIVTEESEVRDARDLSDDELNATLARGLAEGYLEG